MITTISVKNWDRFQHYGNRDPTWIKLYRDMLTSESWVLGTDTTRLVQIAIALLAARYKNAIPNRYDLIKKVASLDLGEATFKKALSHLIDTNFLEIQALTNGSEHVEHPASNSLANGYAREEERREEKDKTREEEIRQDMSDSKQSDVDVVFDHWRQTHNHLRAQLDAKRRTLIENRLREYPQADLCMSITGFLNSPHHMGQNKQATRYDDIENFLRDAKHVDMGLKFHMEPPRTDLSDKTRRIIDQTENWVPPQVRNASH